MIKFRFDYFIVAIVLFCIEVCIALFVNDRFVRPFVGDFLVVIFLFYLLKAFFNLRSLWLATFVLLFSFLIEGLQFLQIVTMLGLENSKLARIVIGTSFEWADILAYTLGYIMVLLIETKLSPKYRKSSDKTL